MEEALDLSSDRLLNSNNSLTVSVSPKTSEESKKSSSNLVWMSKAFSQPFPLKKKKGRNSEVQVNDNFHHLIIMKFYALAEV